MINEQCAHTYCKDDITKIENYDKAINDTTQTWHLHHRLELTLDGEFAHSKSDLQRMNMYYDRPYFELIFLTKSEHQRIHAQNCSDETRKKLSESHKGKTHSNETRKKMSELHKGKTLSDETRKKMSELHKGKTLSDETRKKLSESHKGKKRKPFSEEHRRKMRDAWARRKAAKSNLCIYTG